MKLSLLQIVKLWRDFLEPEWDSYSKEQKMELIASYRKAEEETNAEIANYGSVADWYASGEGRVL